MLIEANALPLSQTANQHKAAICICTAEAVHYQHAFYTKELVKLVFVYRANSSEKRPVRRPSATAVAVGKFYHRSPSLTKQNAAK